MKLPGGSRLLANPTTPANEPSTLLEATTMLLETTERLASNDARREHPPNYFLYFILCLGILGNLAALSILLHKDKRRNRKHLLMLRCLTINDLIAMLLTTSQVILTRHQDDLKNDYNLDISDYLCYVHVLCRLFGLFSGCVALVMAGERWLALTRPFVYQKVTFPMIVRCMILLWLGGIALTCMPFFGFGIWRRVNRNGEVECVRYRDATEPIDITYAGVWFFFGTLLCLSIVWCNLAVARALKRLGRRNGALRRISRASSRAKPLLAVTHGSSAEVGVTPEEKAFAKLMAMLSISFLVCWMPQMISIPLSQYVVHSANISDKANKLIFVFKKIADTLLGLHFTLDPYIYVLLRMPRPRFPLVKPLCRICWPARSRASSFTGTIEQHGSSGDPPTPITEAPSTPVSEAERDSQLVAVAV
ncbi:prostaglandin E2 receptor EP4 subtype isoform X2 [Phymastichus coffea]|uniref:prostaglandin E2 receptor EP4 subtype isoform X2 n=1 Tax=Phymastichus coffea TaxID=108790 RepID=UPI00273C9E9A|nr:prostaglandin E2 receptor EP4 subtype isoform X2 [Phymastichus coffea]